MKFSCEKALLQNAISLASRTVAVKSSIPSLEGLMVETRENQIRITGYDLKTGIRTVVPAEVKEQGCMVLSSRLFGEIIRRMPDDVVIFSTEGYTVNIRCGMSEFNIQGMDATEYPDLPAVDYQNSFEIKQSALRDMIERTSFSISQNDSRPIHTGALFEVDPLDEGKHQLTMVAVDGYRLALRREPVENVLGLKNFKFVVPGSALKEVQRLNGAEDAVVEVVQGERHIMFKTGDVTLVTRRLEGEFLNYLQALPATYEIIVHVDTKKLLNSIERCSLMISEQQRSPVRCHFTDGSVNFKVSTALGSVYDECPVDGDGKELEIGFNNRYLLEALKAVPASLVHLSLNTAVSPLVITEGDNGCSETEPFLYMILPVRLRAGS